MLTSDNVNETTATVPSNPMDVHRPSLLFTMYPEQVVPVFGNSILAFGF